MLPGQFWSVPLSDGSFACGRVIELCPSDRPGSRVSFLAGFLDWHSRAEPTFDSIAGAPCLRQGDAHLKTITHCGGPILGLRPLELDNIKPDTFRGPLDSSGASSLYVGYKYLRKRRPSDVNLPLQNTWGYGVLQILAEHRFVKS